MRPVPGGIIGVVVIAAWTAQDPRYFGPAERVSVRDMSEIPPIDLAPGVHVHTIVGQTSALSVGEFEPGSAAVLHHHTREQADVGVAGSFDMTIGTHVEKLAPDAGVIVPANVDHSIANRGSDRMTVVEFHTVPRPDLVPPRPVLTFPSSPEPVPVRDGQRLVKQLGRPSATGSNATRTITGETCAMTWRHLVRAASPLVVQAGARELLIYVIRGDVDLVVEAGQQAIRTNTAVVVPPHERVTLKASAPGGATLLEFSGERR